MEIQHRFVTWEMVPLTFRPLPPFFYDKFIRYPVWTARCDPDDFKSRITCEVSRMCNLEVSGYGLDTVMDTSGRCCADYSVFFKGSFDCLFKHFLPADPAIFSTFCHGATNNRRSVQNMCNNVECWWRLSGFNHSDTRPRNAESWWLSFHFCLSERLKRVVSDSGVSRFEG